MAFKSRICRARLSPKEGEATLRLVRPNLRAEVSFSLPKLVVFELPFCCYSSPPSFKASAKEKEKKLRTIMGNFLFINDAIIKFCEFYLSLCYSCFDSSF